MLRSRRRRVGAQRHGDVEVVAHVEPREPGRRDADDLERLSLEPQRLSDRAGTAAVFAPPERIAQHHRSRPASRPVVVAADQATVLRRQPQHVEVVAADEQDLGKPDFAGRCEVETVVAPHGEAARADIGPAQQIDLRRREVRHVAVEIAVARRAGADANDVQLARHPGTGSARSISAS